MSLSGFMIHFKYQLFHQTRMQHCDFAFHRGASSAQYTFIAV